MEADTSLVRTNGIIELNAIADIGLDIPLVINPGDAECHDTIRLDHSLDYTGFLKFRMLVINISYGK